MCKMVTLLFLNIKELNNLNKKKKKDYIHHLPHPLPPIHFREIHPPPTTSDLTPTFTHLYLSQTSSFSPHPQNLPNFSNYLANHSKSRQLMHMVTVNTSIGSGCGDCWNLKKLRSLNSEQLEPKEIVQNQKLHSLTSEWKLLKISGCGDFDQIGDTHFVTTHRSFMLTKAFILMVLYHHKIHTIRICFAVLRTQRTRDIRTLFSASTVVPMVAAIPVSWRTYWHHVFPPISTDHATYSSRSHTMHSWKSSFNRRGLRFSIPQVQSWGF